MRNEDKGRLNLIFDAFYELIDEKRGIGDVFLEPAMGFCRKGYVQSGS
ncbi:MAG: hypothetical protein QXK59_05400 [Archaeoglobaceae archaeon]